MLKYTGSCTPYCKITRSSTSCIGPSHGNQTVKMVINFLLSNQTIAVNVTGKVLPLQITCEFSEQDFCKYYFAIWKWIFFCSESFLKMKLFLGNGTCRNDVSSSLPGCLSTQNTVFSTEPETTQGVTSALTEKTNEATSRGEILETSSTSLPFMTSSTHGITNTTLSQENTSSKTTSAVNIVTITQARSSQG